MNWSDEHYVKVYTRETPNWAMLPWQSRALFLLILKKADKAGLIDLGKDHLRSLAAYLAVPIDFAEPGLAGLLAAGTCELRDGVLITPKFLEAQEARKTKIAASREFRDRARDEARAGKRLKQLEPTESPRNGASHVGTLQPDPSPTPAQPEKLAGKKPPAPRPPDPRHAPLVKALVEACPGYAFDGRDAAAVTKLLAKADAGGEPANAPGEVLARWRRALARSDYPKVRTLSELATHWAHFAADSPKRPATQGPCDPSTMHHTEGRIHDF